MKITFLTYPFYMWGGGVDLIRMLTSAVAAVAERNDVECQIVVVFPEAFLAATESATASRTSEPAALPATETTPALSARSVSMDLLLDVELPVSVSFGRAQLQLKDVLKLTTGSIIELNRSVSEPVEIIVNNCVIARGEVVVVEGNFGVRIRQVISRQERMRTLK